MPFAPIVDQTLLIDDIVYRIAEHPAAPDMPYGQEGRAAVVYQVVDETQTPWALKVFKPQYRVPALVQSSQQMASYAELPGLQVCRRTILTATSHRILLRQYLDLVYAVLMPWIEGPTWAEVFMTRTELSPEQSLTLAQSLAGILTMMEERGLAHCDLSGSNLIIPYLAVEKLAAMPNVALVDVEQLYAAGLQRPQNITSGSPGYGFPLAEGVWQAEADRFAGAVLLAEMLTWCDERIRRTAWDESYFEPKQLQRPCERRTLLATILHEQWGYEIARLFEQAWSSTSLTVCPTFAEWLVALPDNIAAPTPATIVEPQHEGQDLIGLTTTATMETAQSRETQDFKSQSLHAVEEYVEQAEQREQAKAGGSLENDYATRLIAATEESQADLDAISEKVATQKELAFDETRTDVALCPKCEREVQEDWENCPNCGYLLHNENATCSERSASEVEPAAAISPSLVDAPTAATEKASPSNSHNLSWIWIVGGLLFLILVMARLSTPQTNNFVVEDESVVWADNLGENEFAVHANSDWQNTLYVSENREVEIEYISGQWAWSGDSYVDASGIPNSHYVNDNVINDCNHGALIVRVPQGETFCLEDARGRVVVTQSGNIQLRINDANVDDDNGHLVIRCEILQKLPIYQ
jgi:hypothetical protein